MQITSRIVELRYVAAGELIEHPRSWRRHPSAQREALVRILEDVGIANACIARETTAGLELIDGHLRADLDPDVLWPVLVLNVTEAEAETLLASLDSLSSMAIADPEALQELLGAAIVPEELFEELHRQHLQAMQVLGRPDADEIPERREDGRVHPGELWALGAHRLICADACDPDALLRLIGDEPAHVLWTDPPYGVDYEGKTAEALTIAGDGLKGLPELLARSFAAADRVLRPGAALYVCHAGVNAAPFIEAFCAQGWRLHQTLVWVKDRLVLGHTDYHHRHEPILYGYRPGPRRGRGRGGWYGGDGQDSVLEVPRPAASRDHPTAKPVELIRRCLQNSSRVHGVVLDPFAGSGSTLVAAEELRRRARLVEVDPVYCDVIVRRWEALSGEHAVRIDG